MHGKRSSRDASLQTNSRVSYVRKTRTCTSCQARRYRGDGDALGRVVRKGGGKWPGEVGPFHVEGATPNDTLAVKILRLRPNRDVAVSTHNPQFGVLAADRWTPMLTDPIPAKRFIWKLDRGRMVGILDLPESRMKRIEVQLSPMLGRVAVAPQGEAA